MGSVTTGAPGTPAQVTNSGTAQNAIFDFVIPKGDTGADAPPGEFLSSYSTPPQSGTSGGALIFDRNSMVVGNATAHTAGSANFTIQEAGYYYVSFHGTVSPGNDVKFPLSLLAYLTQQGTSVPGTGTRHSFQQSSDIANLSFTHIVQVTTVPTTLTVVVSGGKYLYSDISLTIQKLNS